MPHDQPTSSGVYLDADGVPWLYDVGRKLWWRFEVTGRSTRIAPVDPRRVGDKPYSG